jgi:transketolase
MALSEKTLAAQFNRPGYRLIDHHTYVFLGDGCLMEGISHEACSLAGTLGLGKLIAFYDDNGISIDGEVAGWFNDDTVKRFEAYGWQVIPAVDGHNWRAVHDAILSALSQNSKPTLICCKTMIGFGSPNKKGKQYCHGSPLGVNEVSLSRVALDWPYPSFEIPEDIYLGWNASVSGKTINNNWKKKIRFIL